MENQIYDEERCFVRGIGSKGYNLKQELARLRSMPRVIKGSSLPWRSGPQVFHKNMMNPGHGLIQSLHCSQEELAPGGRSQKHGHQNPRCSTSWRVRFYDIHDGTRYDWSAGDLVLVTPGCVHQHFNALMIAGAVLIIKAKPFVHFMDFFSKALSRKRLSKQCPVGRL